MDEKVVKRPFEAFKIASRIREEFSNDWGTDLSENDKINLVIENFLKDDDRWSDEDRIVIAKRALNMLSRLSKPS